MQASVTAATYQALVRGESGPPAVLGALLAITALVYWPGLTGSFLFDDFANLQRLGSRGPIESLELLLLYLGSGFSGPTGRPLSLLSFLIDANNWPADPWPFKRTNVCIHLLVGAVLYCTTRQLLLAIGRSPRDASWIAVFATALWLVNPFLVSTTLYAVQRMTQLAALFMLSGIWCYLRGRRLLATNSSKAHAALIVGLPLCTLLALLSKENGALVPLVVLVIHVVLRDKWATPSPPRWWVAAFLALPSAVIVGYLLSRIPEAERLYASRDFTLSERLLSQPRFLWDYLYHLFIPHIQTQGLFHDGRAVSKGLLEPWTTLPAILGLAGLGAGAWLCRRKWPLLSLAVLFYLGAHLLESTTLPLEVYFEHRNYLPAAFLFLPIAALAYDALQTPRRRLAAALSGLVAIGFSVATWQHAALWGDEDQLLLVWAHTNPQSTRAQVAAAQTWLRNDDAAKALAILEEADRRIPDNAMIVSNILAVRADLGVLSLSELEDGARKIRGAHFDAQALRALEVLVQMANLHAPQPEQARVINDLLEGVRDDLDGKIPPVHRMTLYLQGLLFAGQGDPEAALPYMRDALEHYQSVDAGLRIVSDLAILGHPRHALQMLDECEALLATKEEADLEVSRETFESDIARLRANLLAVAEQTTDQG